MSSYPAIFSQTAFTEEEHIFGSNGARTRDWSDILFDYIRMKSQLSFVHSDSFDSKNLDYKSEFGSNHIHVELESSTITRKSNVRNQYSETYKIELYSNALHVGGLVTDALDIMTFDVLRIFSRYKSYMIAGLDEITTIRTRPVEPPESENNPFQNVYKRVVTIDVEWAEEFNFNLTEPWELTQYGSRYPAGTFVEAVEDDVFIVPT